MSVRARFGFVIRILSIMILGRLLDPTDYGLVTMVTAFTGVLNMFGGFGLFQAAIQRDVLSEEGVDRAVLDECRIRRVAHADRDRGRAGRQRDFITSRDCLRSWKSSQLMFIITGAGIQHGVLLQRRMLFGVSATIEISASVDRDCRVDRNGDGGLRILGPGIDDHHGSACHDHWSVDCRPVGFQAGRGWCRQSGRCCGLVSGRR